MTKLIRAFLAQLTITVLLAATIHQANAQSEISLGWSEPYNLSNSASSSTDPVIVSDIYGAVHVFWSEDTSGRPHPIGSAPSAGNAIFYRRLLDGFWTDPTDLFYGGAMGRLEQPWGVVDDQGIMHLVWLDRGQLMYSSVPSEEAIYVRSWAEPVVLDEGPVGQVRLTSWMSEVFVIYSVVAGFTPGMYIITKVLPEGLPEPNLIWAGHSTMIAQDISATVDGRGRIHVVWTLSQPPSPASIAVQYAMSLDGGDTWSESLLVAASTSGGKNEDYLGHAYPWIAAHGNDEIHIQWAQGTHTYRWHQLSRDGGMTWNQPYQIWSDLISQTRSEAVGEDGDGNLYWADVLRYPNAGYLIKWTGREWARPEPFHFLPERSIEDEDRIGIAGIRMAFTHGNELHLVLKDQVKAEVIYMHKKLESGRISTSPLPTQLNRVTPTPTPILKAPQEDHTAQDIPKVNQNIDLNISGNDLPGYPGYTIIAGSLPVFLLTLVIAIKKIAKK
jgi:hypothetical protein